jgi:uncharacterized membrane protein
MTKLLAPQAESGSQRRSSWIVFWLCMAAIPAIFALTPGAVNFGAILQLNLRAPDFAPLMAHGWLVQLHLATVAVALVLGPVQFALPKGTRMHRLVGWLWAGSMLTTAIASLFIRDMRDGAFSPIHLFSLMTLIGVPVAVWLARSGRTAAHARAMIGLYIGLIIAGLTAIAPGRLIWDMFFS